MKKENYNIYAGLGGSFGGAKYHGTLKNVTENQAFEYAYNTACDEFDSYGGNYGLAEYSDFEEEYPDGTEEEYKDWFNQQREDWIECYAIAENKDENTYYKNEYCELN